MKLLLAGVLIVACVGCGVVLLHRAYARGVITSRFGTFRRAERPILFTIVASLSALTVVAGLGAGAAVVIGRFLI